MTQLKAIVGTKTETHYYRGKVRNVVKTKYTSRTYYSGGFERTETVAVLECGHTIPAADAGNKKKSRCHECEYQGESVAVVHDPA